MKNIEEVIDYKEYLIEELDDSQKALIIYAREMRELAYAPYSNFKLGVAIMLGNSKMIGGNNQENIAYPSGLCAERVAIFSANSQYPFAKIRALALISSMEDKIISPCGACRQVMMEQIKRQGEDFDIILASSTKAIIVKASLLMPMAFDF